MEQGNYAKAAELLRRAIAADSMVSVAYGNLASSEFELGQTKAAKRTLDAFASRFPNNPEVSGTRIRIELAQGNLDSAVALLRTVRATLRDNLDAQSSAENILEQVGRARGQLNDAAQHAAAASEYDTKRGLANAKLGYEMQLAFYDAWYRGKQAQAARRMDAALAKYPLSSIPKLERPYTSIALIYALAGKPERARAILGDEQRDLPPAVLTAAQYDRHNALGVIALQEGKADVARSEFTQADPGACPICPLPGIARAYEMEGRPDSAIAALERYLATPSMAHAGLDPIFRQSILSEPRRAVHRARRHGARGVELLALHRRLEGRRSGPAAQGRGREAPPEGAVAEGRELISVGGSRGLVCAAGPA